MTKVLIKAEINVEKGGREGRTSTSRPNTNPCLPWKVVPFRRGHPVSAACKLVLPQWHYWSRLLTTPDF
jgi:hypothetical protein